MPIGYWKQFEMLMQYERQISSSWFHSAPLVFSPQKKINKDLEISLADKIIVPSSYVEESLPLHPGFSDAHHQFQLRAGIGLILAG